MKRWVARCLVICVGVVGPLAGCGEQPDATPGPVTSTSGSAVPAAASSVPTATQLSAAAYQAELTRIDQVLAGPARALTRVRTAEALSEAMTTLSQTFNTIGVRLGAITVAPQLSTAHAALRERVGVAAMRLAGSASKTEEDARCGGAAYTSQKVQWQLRSDLSTALAQLRTLKLSFGTTLPAPGSAASPERPDNGEVLVRRGANGMGRLKITNGTVQDVAVSVVTPGRSPHAPQLMVYLRAGGSTTVNRIAGAYHLYFKSGTDWDAADRKFRADCSFKKFDQTFGKTQSWQINLQPRPDGNAPTTEVEAY
ncbi:hypothetical protein [Kribbella sp. NPDC048915]|uniref:hypothetical protein n=1 Tax=Kribbella sp. NPDC048915 TaxID=3155148 RepID=UPI0033E129D1